jgi:hypothetical protein
LQVARYTLQVALLRGPLFNRKERREHREENTGNSMRSPRLTFAPHKCAQFKLVRAKIDQQPVLKPRRFQVAVLKSPHCKRRRHCPAISRASRSVWTAARSPPLFNWLNPLPPFSKSETGFSL